MEMGIKRERITDSVAKHRAVGKVLDGRHPTPSAGGGELRTLFGPWELRKAPTGRELGCRCGVVSALGFGGLVDRRGLP